MGLDSLLSTANAGLEIPAREPIGDAAKRGTKTLRALFARAGARVDEHELASPQRKSRRSTAEQHDDVIRDCESWTTSRWRNG